MEAVQLNTECLTSDDVLDLIERVAAAKGKEKQAVLEQDFDDYMVRSVLRYAYDPFKTFGVKKLPETTSVGTEQFGEDVFEMLDALARRELTGNTAKEAIESTLNSLTEKSQTLLRRILLKDMRAGFTAGTCNRIEPGFIFIFECMLAHKFEEKRIKQWPVAAEPKYDGVRSLAIWDGTDVIFYSRTGRVFQGMRPIADAMVEKLRTHNAPPTVFDGELMDRTNSFNKIVGDVHKKDFQAEDAIFYMFDALPLESFQADDDSRSYRTRRMDLAGLYETTELSRLRSVRITPVKVMKSLVEIEAWAKVIMDAGGEGLIVKPLDGLYQKKRSHAWLKIKGKENIDALVVDVEEGTGKYEGMIGALVIEVDGVRVNVGTGLTDEVRAMDRADVINRMIEVTFHERTPDGSLRHPALHRFRDDKRPEDGHGV